ncbi:MAG: alanine dehydrogenase [Patescibacteria group bacterium]
MIIACLKEVKDNENRVALTPDGVRKLVKLGNTVYVERQAGWGSGYADEDYVSAGAHINDSPFEIVKKAELIMKIKEPVKQEFYWLKLMNGKTLFTYLHLSGVDPELTKELLANGVTAIAYETVQEKDGSLPLLAPMSDVAGVLAIQYGANYMQKKYGGVGKTLGKIPGADSALTVVVGGGHVGAAAARAAGGMGGEVVLLDINPKVVAIRKQELRKILGPHLFKNVQVIKSDEKTLSHWVSKADLLIGAVLVPGAKAPTVVSEKMIRSMHSGAVIVDVAIDQGGCIWGAKPTTHRSPRYERAGKIFCCITNMPGQVSRQSTQAITNATLPYIVKMATGGIIPMVRKHRALTLGLNTHAGYLTYERVAKDLHMENHYRSPEEVLK